MRLKPDKALDFSRAVHCPQRPYEACHAPHIDAPCTCVSQLTACLMENSCQCCNLGSKHSIVHLQDSTALSVHLLGSCFTDQLRPPTLSPHHISQYLSHHANAQFVEVTDSSSSQALAPGLPASAPAAEGRAEAGESVQGESEADTSGAESNMDGTLIQSQASVQGLGMHDSTKSLDGMSCNARSTPASKHV